MKDALYVKSKIDDLLATVRPQSVEATRIFNERKDLLLWAYNGGNLRTDKEMSIKLQTIKEELIAWDYANDKGILTKISQAKLDDLKSIL